MKKLIVLTLFISQVTFAGLYNTFATKGIERVVKEVVNGQTATNLTETLNHSFKALNNGQTPKSTADYQRILGQFDELSSLANKDQLTQSDLVLIVNTVARKADESGTGTFYRCSVTCGADSMAAIGVDYYFKSMSKSAQKIFKAKSELKTINQVFGEMKKIRTKLNKKGFSITLKDLNNIKNNMSFREQKEFLVAMEMMMKPSSDKKKLAEAVLAFNTHNRSSYFSSNKLWKILIRDNEATSGADNNLADFLKEVTQKHTPNDNGRGSAFNQEVEAKIRVYEEANDSDRADAGRLLLEKNCFGFNG